jgi:UDP-N-acetylglucosamine--N-acetylmuramyl-(pentapeptide) pyrophosphoryl-undecaprenol N-acetylglucosamine transferase
MPERGFAFHGVDAAPVFGAGTLAGLGSAASALYRGFRQARRVLADAGTEIVIGFGGYVTGGSLLAGRSLGLVTVIFEANVIPGRANRLLRPLCDASLIGQGEARGFAGWRGARVTGHPIRTEIEELKPRSDPLCGFLRILVTGGSLGSAFLDRACPSLCARIAAGGQGISVLHQSCPERAEAVARAYADAGIKAEVRAFLDMRDAYASANFVICAAGAGTLAEIETLGLSALVVPIENVADGHQAANAAAFSARSSLPALRESQWDEGRAAALVNELLAKPPHRNETAPHSHAKAALHVVGICEELLAAKQRRAGSAAPIARSVRPAKS